jgi:uncharacterized protein
MTDIEALEKALSKKEDDDSDVTLDHRLIDGGVIGGQEGNRLSMPTGDAPSTGVDVGARVRDVSFKSKRPLSLETIEKVYERKAGENERLRLETLERLMASLKALNETVRFEAVYIFGSLTIPYRFTDRSDIDLAFQGLDGEWLFYVTGKLSDFLGIDVNAVQLEEVHFKEKILRTGIEWKKN